MNAKETYQVARAVVRVLADSTRTAEIHRVEELTGRDAYERLLARHRHEPGLAALLAERPELGSDAVDFARLRALPPETLGNAYARHLDDNGITADYQAVGTRFVADGEVAYLMRRFRQTHDLWHTLLGLGIEGHEEVLVHAFSYGQLRLPVSALVVAFGSLKHIVLERRWQTLRHGLREAYELGKGAPALLPVRWESLWEHPLSEVREQFALRACTPAFAGD